MTVFKDQMCFLDLISHQYEISSWPQITNVCSDQEWLGLYLTHTGHSGHPAVAGVQTVLLTLLREEEIDLIVISDRAIHTLLHQR